MKHYRITGMSCAACQARVEKAVSAVDGVSSCTVSLLTNSMGVEGTADKDAVIKAVEAAGYGATLLTEGQTREKQSDDTDKQIDAETKNVRNRLVASLVLLLPLMYVSMGQMSMGNAPHSHMLWSLPLPGFFEDNVIAIGIYEMLLAGLVMVVNQKFFINGFKGLLHRSPNMDTLVALGATASFAYSVYALFAMTLDTTHAHTDAFYFESAAMILTLITVGKMLEARAKGKTTNALKALMKLTPKTAVVLRQGVETQVSIDEVRVGDQFVVRPGTQIPVDGIVKEGFGAVDESTFTGESIPVDKKVGDPVSAATINTDGFLICEATKIGEDTALSKIIHMVSDAAATKAPIAKIADRASGVFVPTVMGIAIVTLVGWMLAGQTFGFSLARAISVLVISCPCALGLATPVAIMVGNGVGAKTGILFKTASALEQTGAVEIVVLDKTGTITTGQMQVTEVLPAQGITAAKLLGMAAALEAKSEHPISKAITAKAEEGALLLSPVTDFKAVAGNGLIGMLGTDVVYGGNAAFVEKMAGIDISPLRDAERTLSAKGRTPVYFATKTTLLGLIAVADTIKPDSKEAVEQLKRMGLQVVMLTGDNVITAQAIAKEVGVEQVIASVRPDEKERKVQVLMEQGKVTMVGDGINDAPALTRADVGIAIGAGTDIALDAADVVLTKSSLLDVAAAIRISKATIRNIRENLFWAFLYNVIGIPLAAGCFIAPFGWTLNPMFGAAAMSLSSFCVVSNALRLNLIRPYDHTKDRARNNRNKNKTGKENKTMKIAVKGMMCQHCEAHVTDALKKIDGIEEVIARHEDNLVTLTTRGEVAEADIKAAVEAAGYEYGGIV